MKKILLALLFIGSSLLADIGDSGSKVELNEIKMKLELIKNDDTNVTILDGTKFLRLTGKSSTATSIGEALEGIKPASGTYKAIKWTPMGFRTKAKIVSGAVTYYTQKKEVPEDDTTSWEMTQDESKYASTTTVPGNVTHSVTVTFPEPLVVSDDKPVEIYYINKYTGDVDYSGNLPDVTWISNIMEAFSFATSEPKKIAQFDLIYEKSGVTYKNKINLIFDKNNKLLGSHSSEGVDTYSKALNGGFIKEAIQTNNHYKITTDGEGFPQVVNFDFDIKSCGDYSNLTVDRWRSANPDLTGGNLTNSGHTTCTDINIAK